ncbi:MAG TPA: cysteine desulfurase NifS [Candidatus Limnocylindrales bacterium]|jgi:cysteine desulfurase|nr:cysteine desulfurase NifS [Candidatus Limnocylindrales bacterium]
MSQPPVYFDNNATTSLAPEVLEAMLPFLTQKWGNPSSAYRFGHQLIEAIDSARASVAALMNAEPRELIFTSCGTESINTALHSALLSDPQKRHLVTTAVEHSATLKYCQHLAKRGFEITLVPVNSDGGLDLGFLEKSIRSDTALVSVMLANNETGVIFPIAEIATMCRRKGVFFHTDGVQAAGKVKLDVKELGVDFLSLSGHKFHAPKGIGLLYVRRHTRFHPYLVGGGQERGRRGGTENVANIVALGRAAELAAARLPQMETRVQKLRNQLEAEILRMIPGTTRNGPKEPRLPNTSNISFEGVEAEGILMLLDQADICASSGSACTTGSLDPSHVLVAMGCSLERARASVRFSLGIGSTDTEVKYLLERLPSIVERLRSNAPVSAGGAVQEASLSSLSDKPA